MLWIFSFVSASSFYNFRFFCASVCWKKQFPIKPWRLPDSDSGKRHFDISVPFHLCAQTQRWNGTTSWLKQQECEWHSLCVKLFIPKKVVRSIFSKESFSVPTFTAEWEGRYVDVSSDIGGVKTIRQYKADLWVVIQVCIQQLWHFICGLVEHVFQTSAMCLFLQRILNHSAIAHWGKKLHAHVLYLLKFAVYERLNQSVTI